MWELALYYNCAKMVVNRIFISGCQPGLRHGSPEENAASAQLFFSFTRYLRHCLKAHLRHTPTYVPPPGPDLSIPDGCKPEKFHSPGEGRYPCSYRTEIYLHSG